MYTLVDRGIENTPHPSLLILRWGRGELKDTQKPLPRAEQYNGLSEHHTIWLLYVLEINHII